MATKVITVCDRHVGGVEATHHNEWADLAGERKSNIGVCGPAERSWPKPMPAPPPSCRPPTACPPNYATGAVGPPALATAGRHASTREEQHPRAAQRWSVMRRVPVLVTVTVVAIIAVFLGCLVFLPTWLVQHALGDHAAAALAAADRLQAENDVRSTLLQGLGGLLALGGIALGAVVTMRQVSTSREGQFIDLFTKAIEHLASEKTTVRHGGVYAMEQIAETAPHYRGHIAALLASFIRQQAPWPPSGPAQADAERALRHGELRDDVAGAIAVLARRTMVEPGTGIELEQVDLRGADLVGFDLSRFCFAGANLDNARLAGCDLTRTTFSSASLKGADLTGARLTEADLRGVDLTGADLANVVDLETAMTDGATKGLPVHPR